LLLAFYSSTYPLRGACEEEIISAWLAAQHAGAPPQARVRIINPEPGFDHIPALLRDLKAYALPHDPAGLTVLAEELRTHGDSLKDELSAVTQQVLPGYHGMAPVHAPHFERFPGHEAFRSALQIRETLNHRYDDLKSGKVKAVSGDEVEAHFREKSVACRPKPGS
jgi:hypothetical protein